MNPALRSPVDGIVERAGEGGSGTIAIRDKNGFLHQIMHTDAQHVTVGDPVAAGQVIGTMGNTGVDVRGVKKGQFHVHYQLLDRSGSEINPSAYWDQQGPIDLNPVPPAYLPDYQRYLDDRPDQEETQRANVRILSRRVIRNAKPNLIGKQTARCDSFLIRMPIDIKMAMPSLV